MINIIYFLISADHEIFFGKNYKPEKELLIDTTYKLMDILDNYQIPLTLFTDVCSVFKYRSLGLDNYPLLMDEQLKQAIEKGHDVQLHLHPHWINSIYQDGEWIFDKSKYKLHDFGFNGNDNINASSIIRTGKEYLERLLQEIDNNYQCIAFRAGGWCLQPEKELMRTLLENEIYIDTSIYKGGYINTKTHYIDYRKLPKNVNWYIDPLEGLKKSSASGIFEIPIGTITKSPYMYYQKIKNKRNRQKYLKTEINGVPIGFEKLNFRKKILNKINNFLNYPIMFSFDHATCNELLDFIKYYVKRLDYQNNDYFISIIGHPKVLNETNLHEIDKFCKSVKQNYGDIVEFIHYQDAYNMVFKIKEE